MMMKLFGAIRLVITFNEKWVRPWQSDRVVTGLASRLQGMIDVCDRAGTERSLSIEQRLERTGRIRYR
jgi:hypothetical protein